MKICVIGCSEAGKTTAAEILAELAGGRAANTSDVIAEDLAAEVRAGTCPRPPGLPADVVDREVTADLLLACKTSSQELRVAMYEYAKQRELSDPAYTVTRPLEAGNIVTGTRRPEQLTVMRPRVDWVVWIQRDSCRPNATDHLGPQDADVVIDNNGTLDQLRERLRAFVLLYRDFTEVSRPRRKALV